MTTGQIVMVVGVCLIVASVLLAVIGGLLLHKRKKTVLLEIEREYR